MRRRSRRHRPCRLQCGGCFAGDDGRLGGPSDSRRLLGVSTRSGKEGVHLSATDL